MQIDDIQAIISVGFGHHTAADDPAELCQIGGKTLLCRALAEVSAARISKVLIAIAYTNLMPRWIYQAVQACQSDLAALGLPELQVEILYLKDCSRPDDAVIYAMSHVTTNWVAVISPLVRLPDINGLSLVVEAAQGLKRAVIGLAQTTWETAIQLCSFKLTEAQLAFEVNDYCPSHDNPTVYAGRAIVPKISYPQGGLSSVYGADHEALFDQIIATFGPACTYNLQGPIEDFRFKFNESKVPDFMRSSNNSNTSLTLKPEAKFIEIPAFLEGR